MIDLNIDIVLARLRTDTNFLCPTVKRLCLTLVISFLLVVLEFSVIHNPANWGPFAWRNFH